jgi:hypothetical protein
LRDADQHEILVEAELDTPVARAFFVPKTYFQLRERVEQLALQQIY